MTFGELFAGIGGMGLGMHRAGLRCVWQVELNEYRRKVLERHWPEVPKWDDVRTFTGEGFERPDVICGGFPCQDISNAGHMAGIDGERSGLWSEYVRIIRVFRPRFVVVENVAALLVRGIDRVLGDLAACGFDAEWDCLPASAFGAFSERDRVFILAYRAEVDGRTHDLLEAGAEWRAQAQLGRFHRMALAERGKQTGARLECEPRLARLVHGVSRRTQQLDRIEGIGDAVYPAVAEWIGRRLMAAAA